MTTVCWQQYYDQGDAALWWTNSTTAILYPAIRIIEEV